MEGESAVTLKYRQTLQVILRFTGVYGVCGREESGAEGSRAGGKEIVSK